MKNMKDQFYYYDIYPKVFLENQKVSITIQSKSTKFIFSTEKEYKVILREYDEGNIRNYPERNNYREILVKAKNESEIVFTTTFRGEQRHSVVLNNGEKDIVELYLYSLHEDMKGRYPYRGDLHVHTCRSDGQQDPATVCANYRGHGYDFMVVSDHGRYYPSLEAIDFYKDVKLDLNIVQGEEVHMPYTDVHIVNFGGNYSVNGLIEGVKEQYKERGADVKYRSFDGNCPDIITMEEYTAQIDKLAEELKAPEYINQKSYAACVWAFNHIRKAGGLGIFPHPYWVTGNCYQLPPEYTEYMMETRPFDAFEVLGGERYFEHNGFQTAKYYEDRMKGRIYPIVGSTDTHNSLSSAPGSLICSTIVFCDKNERTSIINGIKDLYSVAIDTIDVNYRVVGDFRFVRYASFLMENYYPIHDSLCEAEGEFMRMYIYGDKERAKKLLNDIHGEIPDMIKKYFAN